MLSSSKKIGIISGLIAAVLCLIAGIYITTAIKNAQIDEGIVVNSVGLLFVAVGFFFVSVVSFLSSGVSVSSARTEPVSDNSVTGCACPADTGGTDSPPASAKKVKSEQKPQNDNKVAIYAGNLSPEFTEEDVRRAFEPFGTIGTINVVMDKASGKCKGFAFVEMPVKDEAVAAIDGLNGRELAGRELKVSAARSMPKPKRPRRRSKATA